MGERPPTDVLVLDALTDEPLTLDEVVDRIGYLARRPVRRAVARLLGDGLIEEQPFECRCGAPDCGRGDLVPTVYRRR